jgi:hypothetical protein
MSNTPKNCEVPESKMIDPVEARSSPIIGVGIFELVTQLWLVDEVQVVVLFAHEVSGGVFTSITGISEF